MNAFEAIVYILTTFAIGISLLEAYLRINKIWKRRQEPEVAKSQSVIGLSLALATIFVWIIYYMIRGEIAGIFDNFIYLVEVTVFLLIGSGLWVRSRERLSLIDLIKQAFRLEKQEANYLLKQVFKPEDPDIIIEILHRLALIDNELDKKEEQIISSFARYWDIAYKPEKFKIRDSHSFYQDFKGLRDLVIDYLDRNPDSEQAAQLKDMMSAIIEADKKITPEEDLIITELMGLTEDYLKNDSHAAMYLVLIVPQKEGDEEIIAALAPESEKACIAGGTAYKAGAYYSAKYAEMICSRYRQENLFSIVISEKDNKLSA